MILWKNFYTFPSQLWLFNDKIFKKSSQEFFFIIFFFTVEMS